MPARDYRGYAINAQPDFGEAGQMWRYVITKLKPKLTHLWSDFDYHTASDAQQAAQEHVDRIIKEKEEPNAHDP